MFLFCIFINIGPSSYYDVHVLIIHELQWFFFICFLPFICSLHISVIHNKNDFSLKLIFSVIIFKICFYIRYHANIWKLYLAASLDCLKVIKDNQYDTFLRLCLLVLFILCIFFSLDDHQKYLLLLTFKLLAQLSD